MLEKRGYQDAENRKYDILVPELGHSLVPSLQKGYGKILHTPVSLLFSQIHHIFL